MHVRFRGDLVEVFIIFDHDQVFFNRHGIERSMTYYNLNQIDKLCILKKKHFITTTLTNLRTHTKKNFIHIPTNVKETARQLK